MKSSERADYASAYTMKVSGEIVVVSDRIAMTITDQTALGVGEPDEEGTRMLLNLVNATDTHVTGTWEEHDRAGRASMGGTVEFAYQGTDRLIGCWKMLDEMGEQSGGTWVLVKGLGHIAGQS